MGVNQFIDVFRNFHLCIHFPNGMNPFVFKKNKKCILNINASSIIILHFEKMNRWWNWFISIVTTSNFLYSVFSIAFFKCPYSTLGEALLIYNIKHNRGNGKFNLETEEFCCLKGDTAVTSQRKLTSLNFSSYFDSYGYRLFLISYWKWSSEMRPKIAVLKTPNVMFFSSSA